MSKSTPKEVFHNYATRYAELYMDVKQYAEGLRLLCQRLDKPKARILDIACGPGNITNFLQGERPDLQVLGIDIAPNMVKLAQVNNPLARFEIMDCMDIDQIDGLFHGIVCGFILPYLSKNELTLFLKKVKDCLFSDGLLYISTMEGQHEQSAWQGPSSGDGPSLFMNYYNEDLLGRLLSESGFKILEVTRVAHPQGNEVTSNDLVLIAQKSPE